jgi:hypothetical protein
MFSPHSKSTSSSNSFLWTFPECPVRIQVHYPFIDRLQKEVLDLAPADREVGGLLIGSVLSPAGDVEICDHFSLLPSSESTKNFIICSDSLTQAVQSKRAPDRRVIGFYRTHLDQAIELRAEDRECIRSKFNNPSNVFLVLRPREGRASGKFFFWQDGAVVGGLSFPFSSTELKTPTWTTVVGGTPKETRLDALLGRTRATLGHARTTLGHARTMALRVGARVGTGISAGLASTQLRMGALAVVAIFIALFGGLRLYRLVADTSPTLGLRAERALLGIVVKWNPASPEIATAKDADLIVWDGSTPPSFVRLTPAQLLAGRTFVASANDRVEVRLDVIGAAGRARTESIVSVAQAPEFGPPSTPATEPTKQAKEEAKASPPAAPVAPPALVTPATVAPTTVAPTTVAAVTPAAPARKAANRVAELSKRPETQPAKGDATAALTQIFNEFTQPDKPAAVVAEEPSLSTFQAAVPIRETRPTVPSELRTQINSDNIVDVEVHISATGRVTAARLGTLKGPVAEALGKTAVNAALGWQFRPATQNGEPVASDKILEFLFRPSTY